MAFPGTTEGRVTRGKYWTLFGVNVVSVIALLVASVAALSSGQWLMAIVLFLLIAPVGIYFRVIMMRRCRDLGWPPALPWITFVLGAVTNMSSFASLYAQSADATGGLGFASLVAMVDFGLMVTLGCVKGRSDIDYSDVFGPDDEFGALSGARHTSGAAAPAVARITAPAGSGPANEGQFDDAIARALDNYRRTGSAVPGDAGRTANARPQRAAPPQPGLSRPAGFGRKMV